MWTNTVAAAFSVITVWFSAPVRGCKFCHLWLTLNESLSKCHTNSMQARRSIWLSNLSVMMCHLLCPPPPQKHLILFSFWVSMHCTLDIEKRLMADMSDWQSEIGSNRTFKKGQQLCLPITDLVIQIDHVCLPVHTASTLQLIAQVNLLIFHFIHKCEKILTQEITCHQGLRDRSAQCVVSVSALQCAHAQ